MLCVRGGESVYARPIGSLMLDRLQDFFFFFVRCCSGERGGMGRTDRKIRPGKERKWQHELQAVFSCH